MSRCGCAGGCQCSVVGPPNGAITVLGAGTANNPFVVTLVLDPSESNLATDGPNGLLISLQNAGLEFLDSDCIEFVGSGTLEDPIVASPRLDPRSTNPLICTPQGMGVYASSMSHSRVVSRNLSYEAVVGDAVFVSSATGARTITLPAANDSTGGVVIVKVQTGGNNVTVIPSPGETLDGGASVVLTAVKHSVTCMSDGQNWYVIGRVS